MATPLPDKLGLYYASKDLNADGDAVAVRIVGENSTAMEIVVTNIDEDSGYWNGAMGFFTTGAAANLQTCFHVRNWDKETNTLKLAQPTPSVPAAGNQFKMFLGGRYRSNTKLLGLKAGAIQPELAPVTSTSITGVTVKYISPYLGTGTLTLTYSFKNGSSPRLLTIHMGSLADGEATTITANGDYIVYAADGSGFILVTVVFASLPAYSSSNKTQTFTLSQPKGSLVPSYEGYETNTGNVSDRYHLLVARNDSVLSGDVMSAFSIWLDKPLGSSTTLSSSVAYSAVTATIAAATNWPSRGFWITNGSQYRYVLYRSDLTLYLATITTGRVAFNNGLSEIHVGDTLTYGSYEMLVDEVTVTSGSWDGQDATGSLAVQKLTVNPGSAALYNGANQVATATSWTPYCRRKSIGSWASSSIVYPAPDIDIGIEIPDQNDLFSNPPDEHTAPDGITFNATYIDQNNALIHSIISAGESIGIWIREHLLESMQSRADVDGDINFAWY
jgi:hypothetical protein